VVLIPTEIQIYDWQWEEYHKRFSTDDSQFERYQVIDKLTGFLKENEIRFLNLLPPLKQAGKTDNNLHPEHWHWSVNANTIAANEIENYLKGQHLIPDS